MANLQPKDVAHEEETRAKIVQNSPLLTRLPPELLNRIYEEALEIDEPVTMYFAPTCDYYCDPPLLQVCREIRSVALPLYYGSKKFAIRPADVRNTPIARMLYYLSLWLRFLGRPRAGFLKHIALIVPAPARQWIEDWRYVRPVRVYAATMMFSFLSEPAGCMFSEAHYLTKTSLAELGVNNLEIEYQIDRVERDWCGRPIPIEDCPKLMEMI